MNLNQGASLRAYCRRCLDGGSFETAGLLEQVLAANQAGCKKTAITALLAGVLQELEAAGREEEFEIVAQLVQRIEGFFSPHGRIALDDGAGNT